MKDVMISIASKQVWPQILSVLHFKPQKLILLHSGDEQESKTPAFRLKAFFEKAKLLESVSLREISHRKLEDFSRMSLEKDRDYLLNLTGGNKLMSFSLYDFGKQNNYKSFYFERKNEIVWLNPNSEPQQIDCKLADHMDPADLIECQLSASWIERRGELITFNNGKLKITDPLPEKEQKAGDELEYQTAELILKLGIKHVRRSLRLKPRIYGTGVSSHNEIDIVFVWKGKLWIVDCKDRVKPEILLDPLYRCAQKHTKLLDNIKGQLQQNRTHSIKDDLVAITETGGLMGKVICVRKEQMPSDIMTYASLQGIEIIRKDMLKEGLERVLF